MKRALIAVLIVVALIFLRPGEQSIMLSPFLWIGIMLLGKSYAARRRFSLRVCFLFLSCVYAAISVFLPPLFTIISLVELGIVVTVFEMIAVVEHRNLPDNVYATFLPPRTADDWLKTADESNPVP